MAATLIMTALPGHLEKGPSYTSRQIEVLGREYGRGSRIIGTVAEAREAVSTFGAQIRAEYPDASFYISVLVRKGDRKPRGFDDASSNSGLGQDDFLTLRDPEAA